MKKNKSEANKLNAPTTVGSGALLGGWCSIFMLCFAILEAWDNHRLLAIIMLCAVLPIGLLCLIMAIVEKLRRKPNQGGNETHQIKPK